MVLSCDPMAVRDHWASIWRRRSLRRRPFSGAPLSSEGKAPSDCRRCGPTATCFLHRVSRMVVVMGCVCRFPDRDGERPQEGLDLSGITKSSTVSSVQPDRSEDILRIVHGYTCKIGRWSATWAPTFFPCRPVTQQLTPGRSPCRRRHRRPAGGAKSTARTTRRVDFLEPAQHLVLPRLPSGVFGGSKLLMLPLYDVGKFDVPHRGRPLTPRGSPAGPRCTFHIDPCRGATLTNRRRRP